MITPMTFFRTNSTISIAHRRTVFFVIIFIIRRISIASKITIPACSCISISWLFFKLMIFLLNNKVFITIYFSLMCFYLKLNFSNRIQGLNRNFNLFLKLDIYLFDLFLEFVNFSLFQIKRINL